jgi:ABC-type lipoprotein release transport system permease subunit
MRTGGAPYQNVTMYAMSAQGRIVQSPTRDCRRALVKCSDRKADIPMAWFPYTQFQGLSSMHVELRTRGNPAALLPEVRRAMLQFAPELLLLQPMTQQEQYDRSVAEERLLARLAAFFGLLAALLVATGLYGTLSYTVSRRTAEVGVRMALGARRGHVLWMVLRSSLVVSLAGVAIGLPLAIAGARFLRVMLFGVAPGDPGVFAAAVAGILFVTAAAALIPAAGRLRWIRLSPCDLSDAIPFGRAPAAVVPWSVS